LFVAVQDSEACALYRSSVDIGVDIAFEGDCFVFVLENGNAVLQVFEVEKGNVVVVNVEGDHRLLEQGPQSAADRHDKYCSVLLELEDHFVEKSQDPELVHVFNVETHLLKVFLIQNELIFIETENVLGRKNDLGKTGLKTDQSIGCDFYILLVDSEKKVGLLAGELGDFEEVNFLVLGGEVHAAPLLFGLGLEVVFGYVFD
jgi:hypothetical protein